MALSIFDIFKVGVGPSSSHTIGPMWAGKAFLDALEQRNILTATARIKVSLFGSLALTGVGHATDKAAILGISGFQPDSMDPDSADDTFNSVKQDKELLLGGKHKISFDYETDLVFHFNETLPQHPNGIRFYAIDKNGIGIFEESYLSTGGGFIITADRYDSSAESPAVTSDTPYPFTNGEDILALCKRDNITIAELAYRNEESLSGLSRDEINQKIDHLWSVMHACIKRGMSKSGKLPVSGIRRRAKEMHDSLVAHPEAMLSDHFAIMDWVTLFAMAVNEENACGGRVVTAPTNGAAGVIPAVVAYYQRFVNRSTDQGVRDFLATAAVIGMLYKMNASISGAEVGCQGEVGVACSMASAGLAAVMGGSVLQVENAAEIGMEHHLGMTCDPVGGLVQVPCIERNSMAAIKSITASRLALRGDGHHEVSLDNVIETMYQTGLDIQSKYRETSQGGLAVYANKLSRC